MTQPFKIYIDRLRDGQTFLIDESFPSDFIGVNESELSFLSPVTVKGEAYIASDELVIRVDIDCTAVLPCSICNAPVKETMSLHDVYWAIPLQEIKASIYNFSELLREQIIIDAPKFAECGGACPSRKEIAKYLKKNNDAPESDSEDRYHPFADLDFKS